MPWYSKGTALLTNNLYPVVPEEQTRSLFSTCARGRRASWGEDFQQRGGCRHLSLAQLMVAGGNLLSHHTVSDRNHKRKAINKFRLYERCLFFMEVVRFFSITPCGVFSDAGRIKIDFCFLLKTQKDRWRKREREREEGPLGSSEEYRCTFSFCRKVAFHISAPAGNGSLVISSNPPVLLRVQMFLSEMVKMFELIFFSSPKEKCPSQQYKHCDRRGNFGQNDSQCKQNQNPERIIGVSDFICVIAEV